MKHLKQAYWLAKIESSMREFLAELLCDAITELQTFYCTGQKLAMQNLMAWMEKYPIQLVKLAVHSGALVRF